MGDLVFYPSVYTLTSLANSVPALTYGEYGDGVARAAYQFFDTIGYILVQDSYSCLITCYAHPECMSMNYLPDLKRCVLLRTAAIGQDDELWKTNVSIHMYFTTGTKGQ